jgi:glycosyltransferase involved in cell wall biosynthesis
LAQLKLALLAGDLGYRGHSVYTLGLAREMLRMGHAVELMCAGGAMLDEFRALGLPVKVFPSLRGTSIDLLLTRRICAHLRGVGVHILHVQSADEAAVGARVAASLSMPYILTVQTFVSAPGPLAISRKWISRVIAVSEPVREHLVNQVKVSKGLVEVIPSGVDSERLRDAPPFSDAGRLPVIGAIGPLEPGRGHEYFLQAVKLLVADGVEAQFLMLGEGSESEHLRGLAENLGISEHVVFLPNVANYYTALAEVDICVVPWLKMGLGVMLMEAMAMGKAVVVSAVDAAYGVIKDEVTGLLVPPGDAAAIKSRVQALLAKPEHAREMGVAARRLVAENFTTRRMAADTNEIYLRSIETHLAGNPEP